jgi:hypothetical protein
MDINLCNYYFPRHLPLSKVPCKACYVLPEYEHLGQRYLRFYREQHPLVKTEEGERESGIEELREELEKRVGERL